ncbi:hypothetical protein RYX36_028789, partial [Vicia faba]
IKLQNLIENHGQLYSKAFESVLGKQKPRRMGCHRRTTTLTRKEMKLQNLKESLLLSEVRQFNNKIQEMGEKHHQNKEETNRKI